MPSIGVRVYGERSTAAKVPRTVPARNASPERPPLSESKMKMVAVSGTLPSAAATASGTS